MRFDFQRGASRSCPVRPQARRPVIFEPGASRSCPLRPQREASAEPIDCCQASSDPPTTVNQRTPSCDSSPGNCDPAVIRRLRINAEIGDFEFKNGRGPGFEPGASRSRTVLVACPLVSPRLPRCPPKLKLPLIGVRPCPPRAAWFRESVPRLCPGACLNKAGTRDTSQQEESFTGAC